MDDYTIDLRDTLRALWRRKLIIVAAIVAVTAGAVGYSARQPDVYTASSKIVIRPIVPAVSFSSPGGAKGGPLGLDVSTDSHAEIMTSVVVAQRVKEVLGSPFEARALAASVSAEPVTDELIQISAAAGSAELAAQLANAFPQQYLTYRDEQAANLIRSTAADLQRRVDASDKRIAALDARVARSSGSERARLVAERNEAIRQQGVTQARLDEVRSTEQSRNGGEVIQPASVPLGPSAPNPKRDGVVGFILGALLGVGLAMLRNNFDDRIRTSAEASAASAAPVVGAIPRAKSWKRKKDALLVTLAEPASAAAEAYRVLRQALLTGGLGRTMKSLTVTSGGRGAGKSATVANLAIACAQSGLRVIAVSADFRAPRLAQFFNLSEDLGLVQALEGRSSIALLQPTSIQRLSVLPSGASGESSVTLLDGPRFDDVLRELSHLADVVIVDAPSMSSGADARLLGARTDSTIVVLRSDMARESGTRDAVAALRQAGAQHVSVVLNVTGERVVTAAPVEQPTFAPVSTNGHSANGHSANGHEMNGHQMNGHNANGHKEAPELVLSDVQAPATVGLNGAAAGAKTSPAGKPKRKRAVTPKPKTIAPPSRDLDAVVEDAE